VPHILIVEDEPAMSWALAEGLKDDGYTIDTFRTAEDACAWLRRGRSDLVISDLKLPGMSGLDLARRLSRGRSAQPVIIVTAYADPATGAALQACGISDWFSKPFHIDQLRRSVRRALAADAAPRRRKAA
jgi:DNA-binding NtrC family response regulator